MHKIKLGKNLIKGDCFRLPIGNGGKFVVIRSNDDEIVFRETGTAPEENKIYYINSTCPMWNKLITLSGFYRSLKKLFKK